MKILFVQNIEGIAGSEKYFWHIIPALVARGWNIEFLSVHKPEFKDISTEFSLGLRKQHIVVHEVETKSYVSLKLLKNIKKIILDNQIQLIHSHLIYADFWSACLKSFFRLKHIITVSTLHGYQENIYTEYCLKPKEIPHNRYYRIAKFTYQRIDHVYACSEGLKNFFIEAGIRFQKEPGVIHHGFDYAIIPAVTNHQDEQFVCAIPGRLVPRKGHMMVLRKIQYLTAHIPNFKLLIIGDGSSRDELQKYCLDNNLHSYVKFIGMVPDVRPLLLSADLVLIPSYAEGLPLVIFEAMSLSKPVIAFNTIGPSEVIEDGKNGYLISPFNEQEFAEKIVQLSKKPDELISTGKLAREYVLKHHSLNNMVDETIMFYQSIS
ncbi:MAG: glycosyltransferase family 4 protein [Crocinitomicaceae bacterium]|nr:glycosyltransferase family 4 protein [Crocinitomicaceae bacterium]